MRRTITRLAPLLISRIQQHRRVVLTLLAAMVFITMIIVLVTPKLMNVVHHAHGPEIMTAEQDINEIKKALQLYKQSNDHYPSTEQGLLALIIKPSSAPIPHNWETGGYINRLPRDPWGNSYQYRLGNDGTTFEVFSFGANGPNDGDDGETVIRGDQH